MVHLIESVDSDRIKAKKIAIDGIQNTINYEVTSSISYESSKQLTAETELSDAVQLYCQNHPDIDVSIKSISPDAFKLAVIVNDNVQFNKEFVTDLVSEIIDECEHIQ